MFYQSFKNLLSPAFDSALRSRNWALLVAAAVQVVGGSERASSSSSTRSKTIEGMSEGQHQLSPVQDGLLLYYDKFSFYSQKVVLALHEKKLHFDSKYVNLVKSEQYESWFLNINPRGEVPVLQDTGKIIPDSARIIDYLEDNFSNGDTPRLIPMDQGAEVRQKVTSFRHLLQQVPEGKLTTGSLLHPKYAKNPKIPFLAPIRKALANAEKTGGQKLREYAEKNPEAKEILLKKATAREERYNELLVEENFLKVLEEVDQALKAVEEELSKHTDDKDWWLCSSKYTIADVELTIVLVRINQLGLEEYFWAGGKKPCIEKYLERVKQRESYKKTVPGAFELFKTIVVSQAPLLISVVTAVAVIVGGAVIAKK